jgi:hypothetical protein
MNYIKQLQADKAEALAWLNAGNPTAIALDWSEHIRAQRVLPGEGYSIDLAKRRTERRNTKCPTPEKVCFFQ